jgi:hypothetical protein
MGFDEIITKGKKELGESWRKKDGKKRQAPWGSMSLFLKKGGEHGKIGCCFAQ